MKTFKHLALVTAIVLASLGGLVALLVGGTLWLQTRQFSFTIPDNYQGFLLINYACPNGQTVIQHFRTFPVEFSATGAACLANPYQGGPYQYSSVRTKSGRDVPVVLYAETSTGYALIDCGFLFHRETGKPERAFAMYWVGDMQHIQYNSQEKSRLAEVHDGNADHFRRSPERILH